MKKKIQNAFGYRKGLIVTYIICICLLVICGIILLSDTIISTNQQSKIIYHISEFEYSIPPFLYYVMPAVTILISAVALLFVVFLSGYPILYYIMIAAYVLTSIAAADRFSFGDILLAVALILLFVCRKLGKRLLSLSLYLSIFLYMVLVVCFFVDDFRKITYLLNNSNYFYFTLSDILREIAYCVGLLAAAVGVIITYIPIGRVIKCKICSFRNAVSARFCGGCGNKLK